MLGKCWFNIAWLLLAVVASHSATQEIQFSFSDILCPDKSPCFDKSTCCELGTGGYGCCPFTDAVCCSDHLHCCPTNSTCDIEHGFCKRGAEILYSWAESKEINQLFSKKKMFEFIPHKKTVADKENEILPTLEDVQCPGAGNQTCADGYTCCMSVLGDYACCPLRDAVCCADKIHCCPKGSFCDRKGGKCSRSINSAPTNVLCPGGEFQCPDRTTCCSLKSGLYGCCPLEKATCCSDQLHCCPHGYTCDEGGICKAESNLKKSLRAFGLN